MMFTNNLELLRQLNEIYIYALFCNCKKIYIKVEKGKNYPSIIVMLFDDFSLTLKECNDKPLIDMLKYKKNKVFELSFKGHKLSKLSFNVDKLNDDIMLKHSAKLINEEELTMFNKILKIKKLKNFPKESKLQYQTNGSAGFDLISTEDFILNPKMVKDISTGIQVELPKNYEMQIRPRSGLAFKNYVTVINSPGTIDCDYRGEVKVLLINHGELPFKIERGMRIAQAVINKVEQLPITFVDELSETKRSTGGFGSTGI